MSKRKITEEKVGYLEWLLGRHLLQQYCRYSCSIFPECMTMIVSDEKKVVSVVDIQPIWKRKSIHYQVAKPPPIFDGEAVAVELYDRNNKSLFLRSVPNLLFEFRLAVFD